MVYPSQDLKRRLLQSVDAIQSRIQGFEPHYALILGSGLGHLAEHLEQSLAIPYWEIPNFPVSTVAGHAGNLLFGRLAGRPFVVMQGRFHYYEGYAMEEVTFPVRVMKLLGAKTLIVSNAAGGVNPHFQVGDLMLIRDHINLMPENPLRGPNDPSLGPRFPSMHNAYDATLRQKARSLAEALDIPLKEGVYLALQGPNLETPAEYRMVRILGADAVGMSTVPEVIVANHMGMSVLGFSVITNVFREEAPEPTTHEDVVAVSEKAGKVLGQLLEALIQELPE